MKRELRYHWIWILIGLILAGCVPVLNTPAVNESNPDAPLDITPRSDIPTLDPSPTTIFLTATPQASPTIKPSATAQKERTLDPVAMCSPLAGHPLELLPDIVSDPYAPPPNDREGRHMGVDFSYYQWQDRDTIAGVEVQSIFSGIVAGVLKENDIPYGYAVFMESDLNALPEPIFEKLQVTDGDALYILYAHLQAAPMVILGQQVACGDILGLVGQTGGVDTPYAIPHLHIEMRLGPGGWRTTEMGFYDTRLSDYARETYLLWRTSGEFRHFDPMLILGQTVLQP